MKEEQSPSLKESFRNSLELTADSPTLKALAQGVGASLGPLGAIASTWVIGRGEQFAKERLESFLNALAEQLSTLEGEAIREDYFATPEGYDLLLKALDESRRTRSDEKRDLYARILAGAVIDAEQEDYSAEEYLNLISDLTVRELQIARSLYQTRPERDEPWESWKSDVPEQLGTDAADLPMVLNRLESSGLLEKEIAMPTWGDLGPPVKPFYRVTSSFERLMEFLGLS